MASTGTKASILPSTATDADLGHASLRVSFSVIAILGYVAFLISGFGTYLGSWRPIPLYIFFGFLVFLFQANLIETRTRARLAYTAFASVFALLYAADVVFNPSGTWHWTRAPLTYVIINFLLFAVLVYDAISRRQDAAPRGAARPESEPKPARPPRAKLLAPSTLATDFAELAILAYIAATLVNLLRAGTPPYVVIDLNQALGIHLPARIQHLEDLDAAIALAATALALLFLGIVGGATSGQTATGETGGSRLTTFEAALVRIARTTYREVSQSLRLVLGPLIYVGSGLTIARLALQITQFFQSAQSSSNTFDLLNPFSPTSRARYDQGLLTLLLVAVVVVTVILSVALVEQSLQTIWHAARIIVRAGQTTAFSLAFFIFSLAFLNAVFIFVGITRLEPFQVTAFALLALLVGGILAAYPALLGGPGKSGAKGDMSAPAGASE
jgi:hypothetical protein